MNRLVRPIFWAVLAGVMVALFSGCENRTAEPIPSTPPPGTNIPMPGVNTNGPGGGAPSAPGK